ncbi:hypothetical protein ACK37A_20270 [Aeromonas veronii]
MAFWIIKMMSTTVGETAADYLIFNMRLGLRKVRISHMAREHLLVTH